MSEEPKLGHTALNVPATRRLPVRDRHTHPGWTAHAHQDIHGQWYSHVHPHDWPMPLVNMPGAYAWATVGDPEEAE